MSKPFKSPRVAAPADSAAGPAAVARVVSDALRKPGLRRGLSALRALNQADGFDCPGCAWPEPLGTRKAVEFCENGAKAVADETTRRRADAKLFARYSLAELAAHSDRWLNDQGRLTEPMVLRPGADRYQPIGWDEACALVAGELRNLEEPGQAVFYTSGRTSNEAAFLWQLFARRLGTNNLPDSSNLCHESSGRAMLDAIGVSKGTVGLGDFALADCIFVVGQNPGSNHPRMLATLQAAKRRGARIVSINPLYETGLKRFRNPQEVDGLLGSGTELSDLHLPVRINGDVALFKGLCKAMLEQEAARPGTVLDHDFILGHTSGFDAFRTDIDATEWASIVGGSGVGEELIREAAELAMQSRATICCWAMGLTQHHNAVANIQGILNFLMLRGNLGRPGAGACPVRGHSNVQGDRTMGITERPGADWLDSLRREFGFDPPEAHGLDAVDAIRAMHAGQVRVFLALGGNFLSASPDSAYTSDALKRCRLTVQVSTKLNRAHLVTGETGLILPALARSEADRQPSGLQFVTCENSMSVVQPSAGQLKPASAALRSEVRIVAELAAATLDEDAHLDWRAWADDYGRIRERIEAAVPGFEDFDSRLERDGHVVLPNPVRDERRFATEDGRARFRIHALPDSHPGPGRYLMMTIRSHDQFNTTVYSDEDRYRGISGSRRVVLMSTADMAAAGLAADDRVAIISHHGDQRRRLAGFAVVPYDIPPGCVATYYPEANPLVPIDQVAELSNTPAYKSVVVSIESLR
jgi:molybdopterin-dependent oxidoreductase alpha subunit